MKHISYIAVIACLITAFSCQKDNYSPPSILLTGALLYKGDSIGVEYNQVPYQLYQYGFGKVNPVGTYSDGGIKTSTTTFDQNGSYSQILFNGDYKLIIPNGQGPFMWKQTAAGNPDTVNITLNGNQTVNLEVMPYYMIRTPQVSAVGTDSVSASLKLEKVITDANAKDIERVSLYINKTHFVSAADQISYADLPASSITDMNNIQIGKKIGAQSQNYVFARIGVKIAGVEDLLFSPLFKIQL